MLTDAELQAIADEYVRAESPEWVAVWEVPLNHPSSVYFSHRHRDWVGEPRSLDSSEPRALGSAGFFIYRENGTIEEFGSGLFAPAMQKLGFQMVGTPTDLPKLVNQMLQDKHSFEATGSFPAPRPWWKFW